MNPASIMAICPFVIVAVVVIIVAIDWAVVKNSWRDRDE